MLVAFLSSVLKRYRNFSNLVIYPFFLLVKRSSSPQWIPRFTRSRPFSIFINLFPILLVVSIGLAIYLTLSVDFTLISHLFGTGEVGQSTSSVRLVPIIPGVTIGLSQAPYLLIALVIAILVHEGFHGLAATSTTVRIKSVGLFIALFLGGAFVEIEEGDLKDKSLRDKAKVISAGVAVNLLLAGVFLSAFMFLVPALSHGVEIYGLEKGYPAYSILRVGDVILSVNGVPTPDLQHLQSLAPFPPYVNLSILRNNSYLSITVPTVDGKIGVFLGDYIPPQYYALINTIYWLFTINFSLALFNALPLYITDGGKLLTEALKTLIPSAGERISYWIQGLFLLMLISAIGLSTFV